MTIPVIAFLNNTEGVGNTTLAYNIAWKLSDLGLRVLACDLDPQSHFTAYFLSDEELETLWEQGGSTVYRLLKGTGSLAPAEPLQRGERLWLLPGDLDLSSYEKDLSENWPQCVADNPLPFRIVSGFWRVIQQAAAQKQCDLAIVDLGPTLGAISRAALVASDFLVIPLAPDLFSLRGLKNLGPAISAWREGWKSRLQIAPPSLELPLGTMQPLGYVVLQQAVRLDRPVRAHEKWLHRIPEVYAQSVLDSQPALKGADPNQLARLKHYHSLAPMAREAHKPIFHLKPADGAIGAHFQAVQEVNKEFDALARIILERAGIGYRSQGRFGTP